MPASIAVGVVYFLYLGVAALFRPMHDWRRHQLGSSGTSMVLVAAILEVMPASAARSVAVACLPGIYLLVGYWLPAQLPSNAAPRLSACLVETDRRLFDAGLGRFVEAAPRLLLEYLEATYLCCYVIVPAGLAWLYLSGHIAEVNRFWTAVLLAALPCYGLLPWLRTRPPRSIEAQPAVDKRHLRLRNANVAVLDAASVGANTFPSGHAAASMAGALAIGAVTPLAGAIFGAIAVSIALASVVGRYHYALDAACGMLAALLAFLISRAV